ncbi:MAG TPA: prepilin-type N-terminal cleavage/methylation domain-containing protein [Longimicrobium sp.]|jgi:prepilin-type N-terminal cleavage/methylation domain-containing protein
MKGRAGFTLIELVIALALAGLAMALVAGSVRAAVDTGERQTRAVGQEHRARVTREFLREAVRGLAVERAGRGDLVILTTGGSRERPMDRVVFSTHGGAVFGWESDLKAVQLLVDADPATPESGVVARVLRTVSGAAVEETLTLLPDVTGMRIRMLDAGGEWQDGWPDATRAPAAIEFRFTGGDAEPGVSPLAALPLRVRVP